MYSGYPQSVLKKVDVIEHKSGFRIFLYDKEGRRSNYAAIGTNCGSIYTKFEYDCEEFTAPLGAAHFLEHQMFESRGENAFKRFVKSGAMVNAYTTLDRTVYYFTGISNLKDNINALLDLVCKTEFTENSIEKEKGIIEQEIKMYQDIPEYRVFYNMLTCMYEGNVSKPIAGTVDSINKITKKDLDNLHKAFYSKKNLVMTVVGDVDRNDLYDIISERFEKGTEDKYGQGIEFVESMDMLGQRKKVENMNLPMPMFCLAYKEKLPNVYENCYGRLNADKKAAVDFLLRIIAGRTSKLYQTLLKKDLVVKDSFYAKCMDGPGFITTIFFGKSKNPEECIKIIKEYISKIKNGQISDYDYDLSLRDIYGELLTRFEDLESIGEMIMDHHFARRNALDYVNFFASDDLYDLLVDVKCDFMDEDRSVVSIIY